MAKRGNVVTERKILAWKAEIESTIDEFARNYPKLDKITERLRHIEMQLTETLQEQHDINRALTKLKDGKAAVIVVPDSKFELMKFLLEGE